MADYPGTGGNDALTGTGADDTFLGTPGNDTIIGGGGFDRLQYFNLSVAVVVNLAAPVGGTGFNGVTKGAGASRGADLFRDIDSVSGTSLADTFQVSSTFAPGSSFIYLYGGLGADTVSGGGYTQVVANYDTATADYAVTVDLGLGTATFRGTTDTLLDIRSVRGDDLGDSLLGNDFANSFFGLGGNDTLRGFGGNDTLDAGAGNDLIEGGLGDDFIIAGTGNDTVAGGEGSNVLSFVGETYAVTASFANVPYSGTVTKGGGNGSVAFTGIRRVNGGSGNDTLSGSDSTAPNLPYSIGLRGGLGNDRLDGRSNILNQANYADATSGVTIDLGAGTASGGGVGTDTLVNVRRAVGSNFGDTIRGGSAGDYFDASTGTDSYDGRQGFNTVAYGTVTGPVTVTFTSVAGGLLGLASATVSKPGATDALTNVSDVRGTAANDTMTGVDTAYSFYTTNLRGGGGNDRIDGRGTLFNRADYRSADAAVTVDLAAGTASDGEGGTDTLVDVRSVVGSLYADVLRGSAEDDRFRVDAARGQSIDGRGGVNGVSYGGDEGAVVDLAAGTLAAGGGTVTLANITVATGGGGNDTLRGTAGDDTLAGSQGSNRLEGRGGNDTYSAGGFNGDAYLAGATVNLGNGTSGTATNAYGGTDTLIGIESASGTIYADTITGASGSVVSYVRGNGGNDTLRAPGGANAVTADYANSLSAVTVNLAAGVTSDDGWFGGTDALVGIARARGSAFADLLTGNGAANHLDGLAGSDTLLAGAGNDTLLGGAGDDLIVAGAGDDSVDGGDGYDVLDLSDATAGITINLGTTGAQTIGADQGRDAVAGMEEVVGSAFDDTVTGSAVANLLRGQGGNDRLTGGAGTDTLQGGAGNDRLDGGTGADVMRGGAGNDSYAVDDVGDGVSEETAPGADDGGADLVTATVSFALGAGLESLRLIGAAASGTGNALANRLTGNEGANRLRGLDGRDTIGGGRGNDTLEGGAGDDILVSDVGSDSLVGGDGLDTLDLSDIASRSLVYLDGTDDAGVARANGGATTGDTLVSVEAIYGSDTGGDSFWGDAGANRLLGLGGNDRLSGKAGVDRLDGGAGNDTLLGGAGADDLTGGTGSDLFVFDAGPAAGVVDRLLDFAAEDALAFSKAAFGLPSGATTLTLIANAAPVAAGPGPVLLYDDAGSGLGALFFDADGAGGAAAIQIARLVNGAGLAQADITLIA